MATKAPKKNRLPDEPKVTMFKFFTKPKKEPSLEPTSPASTVATTLDMAAPESSRSSPSALPSPSGPPKLSGLSTEQPSEPPRLSGPSTEQPSGPPKPTGKPSGPPNEPSWLLTEPSGPPEPSGPLTEQPSGPPIEEQPSGSLTQEPSGPLQPSGLTKDMDSDIDRLIASLGLGQKGSRDLIADVEKQVVGEDASKAMQTMEANDEVGSHEDDLDLAEWKKCVDAGVDIRSKKGQKFSRDPDGGKSANYKASSTADKAGFRKKWAAAQYEKQRVMKVKSKTWTKVDISKGVYLPFSCIIRDEGADEEAVVAAVNYIKACWAMGGVWRKYNRMTQRMEWLYMKQEVHEIFEESWKMYEESQKIEPTGGAGAIADAAATGTPTGAGATTVTEAAGAATVATQGTKRGAKTEALTSPSEKKTCAKSPFDIALTNAMTTKKTFQVTSSKATILLDNIMTSTHWQWARGFWQAQLKSKMDAMCDLTKAGFYRDFLTLDAKDIKGAYKQHELLSETTNFVRELEPKVEACHKLVVKLLKMHSEAITDE